MCSCGERQCELESESLAEKIIEESRNARRRQDSRWLVYWNRLYHCPDLSSRADASEHTGEDGFSAAMVRINLCFIPVY
jgi:hypothetical protein